MLGATARVRRLPGWLSGQAHTRAVQRRCVALLLGLAFIVSGCSVSVAPSPTQVPIVVANASAVDLVVSVLWTGPRGTMGSWKVPASTTVSVPSTRDDLGAGLLVLDDADCHLVAHQWVSVAASRVEISVAAGGAVDIEENGTAYLTGAAPAAASDTCGWMTDPSPSSR